MVLAGSGSSASDLAARVSGSVDGGSADDFGHGNSPTIQAGAGESDSRGYSVRRIATGVGGESELRPAAFEQEHYVLRGSARARVGGEEVGVFAGDCVYIPAGALHGYRVVDAPFEYLRLVPRRRSRDDSADGN